MLKEVFEARLVELMKDPRVAKLMQHPAAGRLLMSLLNMSADMREGLIERVQRVARSLDLVSKKDLDALKKELRTLQQELAKQRGKANPTSGPSSNTN